MNPFDPEAFDFDHPVSNLRVMQTHISWILLTGQWAYKIKKPVRFDFVDYSTLELRHHFCQRELELNRRFAPQLYDSVVPISRSPDGGRFRVGDCRDVIEYAVKMRQFDQRDLLPNAITDGRADVAMMEPFARSLARFHEAAAVDDSDTEADYLERVYQQSQDNLSALRTVWPESEQQFWFRALVDWTHAEYRMIRETLSQRFQQGFVRCCHGDLHCGNIVLFQDRLIPFDGIEFNDDLIWIDTANELAFPIMDLTVRGQSQMANRLLNAYLEHSLDYAAAAVLSFFQSYRALVRAKVAVLNPENESQISRGPMTAGAPWFDYLAYALGLMRPLPRFLAITCGVSGSGKSHAARQIADQTGAWHVRSDVLRRAMRIESPDERYSAATTRRVYQRLYNVAREILQSGRSVVVDATFLRRDDRRRFAELSNDFDIPFYVVALDAPPEVIQQRLADRREDPSEATFEIAVHQLATRDPIAEDERRHVISPEDLIRIHARDSVPLSASERKNPAIETGSTRK